jgi:hypothetical protein
MRVYREKPYGRHEVFKLQGMLDLARIVSNLGCTADNDDET